MGAAAPVIVGVDVGGTFTDFVVAEGGVVRIHKVPDYAYFNHSAHVTRGVGCVECHGRVDRMPRIERVASLEMQWCLGCHRDPTPHLRPHDQVFDMASTPPADAKARAALAAHYHLQSTQRLTDCSTCHR